ncbi:MAG: tRNA pseudouridine(13) synthase TruD [Deltaproteobacteria bacterium]|nr:tRNA pseudouridine(13) synthase TruD [Deltaproteobacteria bacterium]
MCWRIKQSNQDFIVVEIPSPANTFNTKRNYSILTITKSGLRTITVIEILCRLLNLPESSIVASGLKDEDAITTQWITVKQILTHNDISNLNKSASELLSEHQSIRVSLFGYSDQSARPGDLLGNAFTITIRNVSDEQLIWLTTNEGVSLPFINYYDCQRFGLPTGPKLTHRVGDLLINKKSYSKAFEILSLVESELCNNKPPFISARKFFNSIGSGRKAFYMSSYRSYLWNESVRKLVLTCSQEEQVIALSEGEHCFVYLKDIDAIFRARPLMSALEMKGFKYFNAKINEVARLRPITVSAAYKIIDIEKKNSASINIVLSFMLPCGSYATSYLKQLEVFACKH